MLPVLRIIGIVNAALWFGSALFYIGCVRAEFQSDAMLKLLPPPFAEAAMHLILSGYLSLLLICSVIAVLQLWAEQWYTGRPVFRIRISMLLFMVFLAALLKFGIFPAMKNQHLRAYQPSAIAADAKEGMRTYRRLKIGFHCLHLFHIFGALSHVWYVSQSKSGYKLLGMHQFRG
ncbi:MAG: hypothetical protein P8L18_12655 [Verrucomicrobiota bacterium]|nr:hypothetical protein [Verrucomicrobiota bacterium]